MIQNIWQTVSVCVMSIQPWFQFDYFVITARKLKGQEADWLIKAAGCFNHNQKSQTSNWRAHMRWQCEDKLAHIWSRNSAISYIYQHKNKACYLNELRVGGELKPSSLKGCSAICWRIWLVTEVAGVEKHFKAPFSYFVMFYPFYYKSLFALLPIISHKMFGVFYILMCVFDIGFQSF